MRQHDPSSEFPPGVDQPPGTLDRREWMKLLAAGLGLAGVTACAERRREKILPYVEQPPEVTPGVPLHYATSLVLDGFATGVVVESHEGRPTKVDGNPEHPASLGATGAYEQASVLDVYDPARLREPRDAGAPVAWDQVVSELRRAGSQGPPPWIVMHPQSSPSLGALLARVRERYPGVRVSFHSPLARRAGYAATRRLYGRPLDVQYRFDRARVVVSLGADFLAAMPMSLRWARDFAAARRPAGPAGTTNRLYVAETMLTPTGSLADHRLAVAPSELRPTAAALLGKLGRLPEGFPAAVARDLAAVEPVNGPWIRAVARDLAEARGASIVVAGDRQPAETQLLAHALNAALGNFGQTVFLTEPALLEPEGAAPLGELAAALSAGQVGALLIVDANPVLTAPPELELRRLLKRAQHSFHLTPYRNETSRECRWLLPLAHYLESWGDARAYDGTLSYVQPLIEPLYSGRSAAELLASLVDVPRAGYELLRDHTRRELGASAELERLWEERLKRGFVPDSGFAPVDAEPDWTALAQAAAGAGPGPIELNLEASPSTYDGRFANNGWLLELPHPLTKQTWGNAAVLGPETAAKLGVETGRVLELSVRGRTVRAPALVLPGHAERALTVELGWGRDGSEVLAQGVGTNAYPLVAEAPSAVSVTRTAEREELAITQEHWRLQGRPIALETTLAEYARNPGFTREHRGRPPSWLPRYDQRGPQWAMTIDTTICTGCSACVVACQAENNIPVVGKRQVLRSREMHWLRIDRYFVGPPGEPRVVHQPMLCQHCEKAPCEYVCPVNATVHSPDGLNEMVYNRCIGTRFCSNNCPYKVRRFNWFDFSDASSLGRMQKNPEVTVRERGVMEKCTYCVQRLRRAEVRARKEGRKIVPNEVVTACQQACPTRAIQFGLLEHAQTEMVRWRREPRVYAVLHDLGTRPRTLYLAKLRNPEPEYGA